MKPRALLLAAALFALLPPAARAVDGRFSQMLTTNESVECGVNRLSSDQAAVLDALVRRDLATQAAPRRDEKPLPEKFSQRLTADERRNAGFALMSEAQVAKLDTYVERYGAGTLARSLLAPPVYYPTGMRLRPMEGKTAPEIHGSFTLQFGVGSGGYSEKAGGVNLNYTDPVRNFALSFGYWESHTKGGGIPYRDGYYDSAPPFVP
jgi:hypothetical protein